MFNINDTRVILSSMYIKSTKLFIFFNCVLRKQKEKQGKREKRTKGIRKKWRKSMH